MQDVQQEFASHLDAQQACKDDEVAGLVEDGIRHGRLQQQMCPALPEQQIDDAACILLSDKECQIQHTIMCVAAHAEAPTA